MNAARTISVHPLDVIMAAPLLHSPCRRIPTYSSSSSISSTVAPLDAVCLEVRPSADGCASTAEASALTGAVESSPVSPSPSPSPSTVESTAPLLDLDDRLSFLTRFFFLGSSYAQTGTNESNWRQLGYEGYIIQGALPSLSPPEALALRPRPLPPMRAARPARRQGHGRNSQSRRPRTDSGRSK